MPYDKNVKLMLFCSHCLRRCATFAARLDEPLLLAWNYILHLRFLYHILPRPPPLSLFSGDRAAVLPGLFLSSPLPPHLLSPERCYIQKTSYFVRKPALYRTTGFMLSFVRFSPLNLATGATASSLLHIVYTSYGGPRIIKTIGRSK